MTWGWLDQRPIIVAIAGSNGAGKTTLYHAHIAPSGLRFVNADHFAKQLDIDAYSAAAVADSVRRELVRQRDSFAFETVFSDPVGDKLNFLREAMCGGYHVVLCFIGIADADMSGQRVAMRVSQGGHDVPAEKLVSRFPRTLANLQRAIVELPHVLLYDNSDLAHPYRLLAAFAAGQVLQIVDNPPFWFHHARP
jgi:predicted ABC-type ATPase